MLLVQHTHKIIKDLELLCISFSYPKLPCNLNILKQHTKLLNETSRLNYLSCKRQCSNSGHFQVILFHHKACCTKYLFLWLLTHEVEIALSSKCMSNEANHFMKLYSTINNWSKRGKHTHICIHLCIHQPECQCLITNEGLHKGKKILQMWKVLLIYNYKKTF